MKRKSKGILVVFLALVMLAMTISGCAKTESPAATSEETSTAAKTSEATQEGTEAEPTEEVFEPVTVTCWTAMADVTNVGATDWNANKAIQLATEATGVTIEWQMPAAGQADEQFSLLIVSDALPDMIWWWDLNSQYPGGATAAINEGFVIAIDEYMADYAPNYTAYLAKFSDADKMAQTDDGAHFGILGFKSRTTPGEPYASILDRELEFESYLGLIINEEWLTDLGISKPVTIDDWTNMLTAFKTEKGSEAPLTAPTGFLYDSNAFVSAYDTCHGLYSDSDNVVHYGPAEEGYLGFLTLMNSWYETGLLDPDYLSIDSTGMMAKILNEESGAYAGYGSRIGIVYRDSRESNPDIYPIGVLNPVLSEGQELIYGQKSNPVANFAAVTADCTSIEGCLKFWDYFWSEEGDIAANWGGVEGETYVIGDNGYPSFGSAVTDDADGYEPGKAMHKYILLNGPFGMSMENRYEVQLSYGTLEAPEAPILWRQNGSLPNVMPPVSLTLEESSAYATAYSDIKTYFEEMRDKFIMGLEPLENYDGFVSTLYDMGLQEVLDIQQDALDRYNNR